MELMQIRHGIIASQPNQITITGRLAHFETNIVAPLIISGNGNITVCGRNIFDYQHMTRTNNRYFPDTGSQAYTDTSGYFNEYIQVQPGQTISISGGIYSNIYKYGANKQWLGRVGTAAAPRTVTLPSDVYFIRLQYRLSDVNPATIQLEIGANVSPYEAYKGTTAAAGSTWQSFEGVNNVWSDSGNVTVKYWAH